MWTCSRCRSLRTNSEGHCPECGEKRENCVCQGLSEVKVVSLPNGGVTIQNAHMVMALSSAVVDDRVGLTP